MLYDYHKYFINYLIFLYGGRYEIRDTILFIWCGDDRFHVNLLDNSRFGKYTFFHKNRAYRQQYCHKQFDCRDLEFGLFKCFTHDFNKKYGIPYTTEDWIRFKNDALTYKILEKVGDMNEQ